MTYTYNKQVNSSVLFNQITQILGVSPAKILVDGNIVTILFNSVLNSGDVIILDNIVDYHVYSSNEEETITYFLHDSLNNNLNNAFKGNNIPSHNTDRFLFILPKKIQEITDVFLICIPSSNGIDFTIRNLTFNLQAGSIGYPYDTYNSFLSKEFQLASLGTIHSLSIKELFSSINFNDVVEDIVAGLRVSNNGIGNSSLLCQAITVKYISK